MSLNRKRLAYIIQLAFLLALAGATGESEAQNAVREWRVVLHQVSGNVQTCRPGGTFWVREGNGKLTLLSSDKYNEVWSIPQAADGSVNGETRTFGSNLKLQMQIAGPIGPREFEYLNWTQACRYKALPMKD